MELHNYKNKLKLLFDKFLQNKYELDCYYSEKLITCFESNGQDQNKILLDVLLYALSNIENTSQSVKIFIMNLLTLIMKNELLFSKLLHTKGFYALTKGKNITKQDVSSPLFRLACIKQATVQIQHSTGLLWVIEHNIWLHIFNCLFENQPSHVSRASYNFLTVFIWRLNELNDEAKLMMTLEAIVKPIVESDYKNIKNLDSEMEVRLIAQLKPSMLTLLAILNTSDISKIDKVVQLLGRYFVLEAHFFCYLEVTRDNEFAAITSELICLSTFSFANVLVLGNLTQQLIENEHSIESISYFNIMHLLIHKRMIPVVVDFAIKSILYWEKFGQKYASATFERYGRTFVIPMQWVIVILVPFMCYTESTNPFFNDPNKENGLTKYIAKLGHMVSEQVVKLCYMFRMLLGEVDKRSIAIMTIRNLTRLKGHLTNDQATTIFQAIFYVLGQYIPVDGSGSLVLTESKVKSVEDIRLLSLTIDVIRMLLNEHNINWYDSCEVICLYNTAANLLKTKSLPSNLVIQALDLINLTVSKFLSPDLRLLMESKTGSVLNEIGEMIKLNMADSEWEVRDSAMNLLLTCTEISFVKYIPFQKLIATNELLVDAAQAAVRDQQMYVQATALKCMAAASRLDCIWKQVLDAHSNFYIDLIYICQHHPEGIVRKEAIVALTEISIKQKLQNDFKKLLYSTMYNAAINDLHWEVQLVALTFWKKTIQSHFSNRGMIDGKFPSVTFSREKRKIITLNREEIRKQLAGILNELSLIGCLYVLTNCMSENSNLKVMEYSYTIATEFLGILTKHDFVKVSNNTTAYFPVQKKTSSTAAISSNVDKEEYMYTPMDLTFAQDPQVAINRDNVIDSIVNTVQAELINKLYEDYVEVKMESTEEEVLRNIPEVKIMHPNQFIEDFRNNNYKNIIENKKKWNSGTMDLNSLLDEIISLDVDNNYYITKQ